MKYQKIKYKYRLYESESRMTDIKGLSISTPFVRLRRDGTMTIRKGYAWNGSNWSIDWKSKTASMYHDAGYQFMRLGMLDKKYREYLDELYRIILLEKGLWKLLADFRYTVLRNFGGTSAKLTGKPENPVFEE